MKTRSLVALLLVLVMLATVIPFGASAAVVTNDKYVNVRNAVSQMSVFAKSTDTLYDAYANVSSTSPSKVLSVGLSFQYSNTDKNASNDTYPGRVFPIEVSSAGVLAISSSATQRLEKDVDFGLYFDSACSNAVDSYIKAPKLNGNTAYDYTNIPNAGTYYLKVSSYNSSYSPATFTNIVNMKLNFYTSVGVSMAKSAVYYLGDSTSTRYHKITLSATSNVTLTSNQNVRFTLCNANKQTIYDYQSINKNYGNKVQYRLGKGVYYIKIDSNYSDIGYYTLKYTCTADATMKNKQYTYLYPGSGKCVNYLKIKPTSTGYITLTLKNAEYFDGGAYVTLLNSSKKAISAEEYLSATSGYSNKVVFGVAKNTTYYIKLTGADYQIGIKYVQTSIAEKSGSSRKSAKTLKKNSTVKGTITAASSRADYYKIKVTKSQFLNIYAGGSVTGSVYMQIYRSNGSKYGSYMYAVNDINSKKSFKSFSKLSKGTYYIKVYRKDSKSNGYYTLKWK